jgi:hypothetical protein
VGTAVYLNRQVMLLAELENPASTMFTAPRSTWRIVNQALSEAARAGFTRPTVELLLAELGRFGASHCTDDSIFHFICWVQNTGTVHAPREQ